MISDVDRAVIGATLPAVALEETLTGRFVDAEESGSVFDDRHLGHDTTSVLPRLAPA